MPPVPISEGWQARLRKSDNGKILPILANAIIALQSAKEWQGVLYFNDSALKVTAKSAPPWDESRAVPFDWTDTDDIRTANWLQSQGIIVNKETAAQAVQAVARDHRFHPVREYLESLTWDGVPRIDDLLTLYLGAESSDYIRAIGAKFLIGAVARVFHPGCKVDCCLILEGPQGKLKSTSLRTLAGEFFTDDIAEIGSKDSAMQLRGKWIVEMSELDSLSRADSSRIKAFISRQVDCFRPPYGRHVITAPRECVFAGTTNRDFYLKDETGGRRFWPVRCGVIKIPELKRDRDQLWAEARERYRAGERWWLDTEALEQVADREQQARYDADPWDEKIIAWVEDHDWVTVSQILESCLGKGKEHWTQTDQNRVARCLRAAGWERKRKRVADGMEWRYYRCSQSVPTSI
jgi:predicted P-loop ATPase